jgi:hypothetical protein
LRQPLRERVPYRAEMTEGREGDGASKREVPFVETRRERKRIVERAIAAKSLHKGHPGEPTRRETFGRNCFHLLCRSRRTTSRRACAALWFSRTKAGRRLIAPLASTGLDASRPLLHLASMIDDPTNTTDAHVGAIDAEGQAVLPKPTSGEAAERTLSEAARRALAEAAERRANYDRRAAEIAKVPELAGRGGPEPVRYDDWEVKGRAVDF